MRVDVRWLGHSSVLLEAPGIRVLTDPYLRDRLGPLKRRGPVPQPRALGPIGIVVISHAHPDHFDRASLRALGGDPLVIVPRGLGGAVRRIGLRAREVETGETVAIAASWTVTAVPARHWRWPSAPRATSVGYLIEGPGRAGIYFAGDTAAHPAMRDLAGRVDLGLLPVGSWGPHLGPGHLTPRSAAAVARDLEARTVIPIHWGTFQLPGSSGGPGPRRTNPAQRFEEWSRRLAPDAIIHALDPGGAVQVEV